MERNSVGRVERCVEGVVWGGTVRDGTERDGTGRMG